MEWIYLVWAIPNTIYTYIYKLMFSLPMMHIFFLENSSDVVSAIWAISQMNSAPQADIKLILNAKSLLSPRGIPYLQALSLSLSLFYCHLCDVSYCRRWMQSQLIKLSWSFLILRHSVPRNSPKWPTFPPGGWQRNLHRSGRNVRNSPLIYLQAFQAKGSVEFFR